MLETATKIVPKRTGCCSGDLLPSAILRKPGPSSYMATQVMSLNADVSSSVKEAMLWICNVQKTLTEIR